MFIFGILENRPTVPPRRARDGESQIGRHLNSRRELFVPSSSSKQPSRIRHVGREHLPENSSSIPPCQNPPPIPSPTQAQPHSRYPYTRMPSNHAPTVNHPTHPSPPLPLPKAQLNQPTRGWKPSTKRPTNATSHPHPVVLPSRTYIYYPGSHSDRDTTRRRLGIGRSLSFRATGASPGSGLFVHLGREGGLRGPLAV